MNIIKYDNPNDFVDTAIENKVREVFSSKGKNGLRDYIFVIGSMLAYTYSGKGEDLDELTDLLEDAKIRTRFGRVSISTVGPFIDPFAL